MPESPANTNPVVWTDADLAADPHAASDKSDRVRRMFEAIAPRYDLNNRLHSFGLDQRWRRRAVRAAELNVTDDVLDVACGTGDLALAFTRAGAKSVIGVDFTDGMLEIARRKAAAARLPSNATPLSFEQGDAANLRFSDHTFDVVSIAFGIRNVDRPKRALAEFRRILRPAGRLVILEFSHPRNPLIRAINSIYTKRVMPLTASLIARDRTGAYRYLPRSVATFPEGEAMADLIRDSGFADVRTTTLSLGVCTLYVARVPGA